MRIEFGDGQWAELYDTAKVVSRRKRAPAVEAISAMLAVSGEVSQFAGVDPESLTEEQKLAAGRAAADAHLFTAKDAFDAAVIAAMVKEWSFGPVTVDAALDLPGDVFDRLDEVCAPFVKDLMPDFSSAGATDPKAPTGS